jgi:hypothetical protein
MKKYAEIFGAVKAEGGLALAMAATIAYFYLR